ncbi:hypothetical protein GALL_270540 [mine drainage metagenome]|uniref:Uncharacterized protein n=1 Tax=mine drainage metagenome TaxID=410659 RepID=A0A1J5R511_9ZZZZ
MSVVFSGTWIASLPRQNVQTKIIFSSTNSTVTVETPTGQQKSTGIWAEDGNGNFVIQYLETGHPFNGVWSGTHDATSGSGFHVEYSQHRQLAGLERATFAKQP